MSGVEELSSENSSHGIEVLKVMRKGKVEHIPVFDVFGLKDGRILVDCELISLDVMARSRLRLAERCLQ